MLQLRHSWILRYSIAVFASLVALALTQILWYQIQPALYPFFLAAVMLSSWAAGLGPGLVSTVLGAIFSEHFFLAPGKPIEITWANLGRISYFMGVAVLICTLNARLRHAQERAEISAREAESANQAKDEFLAILSHELRTPLTAITGWLGMLRSGRLDHGKTALALETLERNATHQMQLVEDLLDISRIIRGDLWLESQPVDLVEVVQATIKIIQPKIEEKRIQFLFEVDSSYKRFLEQQKSAQPQVSPVFVLGDPDRLEQVVLNLLSNAVKFTPEQGKIAVNLSVVAQVNRSILNSQVSGISSLAGHHPPVSHAVQLQVKDTGIGITQEFLPHVFDRFRQADSSNSRSYKGLGLGLAISRYLVERQGGTIQASSPGENQGTTFTVQFPLSRTVENQDDLIAPRLSASPDFTLKGLSILVVDDEVDTRSWLKTIFELYQARVLAVPSVDAAMAQLHDFSPNMIVSDIAMPGKNGYVLMKELQKYEQQSGRSIPAISLTAHASLEDIEKALTAGFQEHLSKPIKAEDLMVAIIRVLDRCSSRSRNE